MMITVNGGNDKWKQSFLTAGAWTVWEERAIVLPLTAGINRIRLQSNTAEGGAAGGTDFTHFTESGAKVTAGIICNGIKAMNIPLANEVK